MTAHRDSPVSLDREDLDVSDATLTCPDLTSFCCLDGLGLEVTGQRLEPERAVLVCRPVDADDWCHDCGGLAARGAL